MATNVGILRGLSERFRAQVERMDADSAAFVLLVGLRMSEPRKTVLMDAVVRSSEPTAEEVAELRSHLAEGVEVVGVFRLGEGAEEEELGEALEALGDGLELSGALEADALESPERLSALLPGSSLLTTQQLRAHTATLSVHQRREIWIDVANVAESAEAEFQRLRDEVSAKTRLYQCNRSGQLLLDPNDARSLAQHVSDGAKKPPPMDFTKDLVSFRALDRSTGRDLVEEVGRSVPTIRQRPVEKEMRKLSVELWGLAVVSQEMALSEVAALLSSALLREVDAAERAFAEGGSATRSRLFLPPALPYFVRRQEPKEDSEQARSELHALFGLSLGRPAFKAGCRFTFEPPPYPVNPHEALKPTGLKGTVALVPGRYWYRHYMQDGFDDDKWGCAYRAFQTLWSWLQMQGYVSRDTPSHSEIQSALVDCGDRPPKFVGSREWIGSLELSFVLSQLAGLEARIMRVESGAEMGERARELQSYFSTQGAPVMIGGGVLAHTIAGVEINEESGEVRFLVLDPHYTGHDDLKTIVAKGWVAWKPLSFWQKDAFYNLLLPILPQTH